MTVVAAILGPRWCPSCEAGLCAQSQPTKCAVQCVLVRRVHVVVQRDSNRSTARRRGEKTFSTNVNYIMLKGLRDNANTTFPRG
jgi:hypothetical protein